MLHESQCLKAVKELMLLPHNLLSNVLAWTDKSKIQRLLEHRCMQEIILLLIEIYSSLGKDVHKKDMEAQLVL